MSCIITVRYPRGANALKSFWNIIKLYYNLNFSNNKKNCFIWVGNWEIIIIYIKIVCQSVESLKIALFFVGVNYRFHITSYRIIWFSCLEIDTVWEPLDRIMFLFYFMFVCFKINILWSWILFNNTMSEMCSVVLLYWTKKSLNNYNYVPRDRTDGEANYIFKRTTLF